MEARKVTLQRTLLSFLPFVGSALLAMGGCGLGQGATPELPVLAVDDLLPVVQYHIRSAWEEASQNPDDAESNGRLGMVFSTYSDSGSALPCFERAMRLAPADFRWSFYRAVTLSDLGRVEDAIDAFDSALELRPDHVGASLRLAALLRENAEPARSAALYERVLAIDPGQAEAHYGLGSLFYERGDLAGAVDHLRAALASRPRTGPVHYALAQALQQQGEQVAAEQHLALFEQYEGQPLRSPDPLISAVSEMNLGDRPHLTRAHYYMGQRRWSEAIDALTQTVSINPGNTEAHVMLLGLYGRTGAFDLAEEQFRTSRNMHPDEPELWRAWGVIERRSLHYDTAVAAFRRAADLDPDNADLHVELGFVLEKTGASQQAAEHYTRAIALSPEHSDAHFRLGSLLVAGAEHRQAVEHLEKSNATEDPVTPVFLRTLSAAYAGLGERDRAVDLLREALELAHEGPDVKLVIALEDDLARLTAMSGRAKAEAGQ